MSNWADEWDYQGKKFTRCLDCKKAMPVEWKDKHSCGTQKEVKEFQSASEHQVTNRDIIKTAFNECLQDVLEATDKCPVEFTSEDIRTMINTLFMTRTRR